MLLRAGIGMPPYRKFGSTEYIRNGRKHAQKNYQPADFTDAERL